MGKSGYWNKDILLKLMKDGNYDPFDPARTSDSLFQASFAPTEEQNADVYQINFLVDGELGELPAGPLSMAVGLSYLKESFSSTSDPLTQAGKIPGSSSNNGLGDRYTQSVFFEISAPIAQRFDSSLAMRFDDYERYGTGISPRLNLAYRSNDWLFRSSLGTGFRVPTLNEENVAEVTGAEPFVDYVRCNKVRETVSTKDSEFLCKESSYTVTIVAPKDLKTEKTAMASLGAVYEPKPALHLSLDAWYIQIKDRIGVPDYSLITKAEADGAQNLEQNGINIVRDNSQRIINLIAPAANLSTQELAGLDLSVMAKLGSKKQALFTYSIDGSYQIFNRLAAIEGQPLRNRIGNSDLPQWKVHNTMSMILAKDHRLSLTARTTSAMRKVNEDLGKVPAYSEYDLSYLLSDFFTGSLTAGVTNITNGKPPKDESASPTINYDLYSYRGRSYFAGLSQNF
jgi:iron complex outermembrane receptor protein